jgi:hypothetical protein
LSGTGLDGRVTPDRDQVRVQVNSHRRLAKLLQILTDIGAEPEVAGQAQSEPSLDFAWGPVPDGASPAREWETAWLEQPGAVLDFHSPHAAASAAEGNTAGALRLEGLLRQLEYQAGLTAARGERPFDTEWLRTARPHRPAQRTPAIVADRVSSRPRGS